jgi:hypothetical protein
VWALVLLVNIKQAKLFFTGINPKTLKVSPTIVIMSYKISIWNGFNSGTRALGITEKVTISFIGQSQQYFSPNNFHCTHV